MTRRWHAGALRRDRRPGMVGEAVYLYRESARQSLRAIAEESPGSIG